MTDFEFEPPSFSLGLDLDLDPEPQPEPIPQPDSLSGPIPDPVSLHVKRASTTANLRTIEQEEDDDFESPPVFADARVSGPTRVLKRLRRGPVARVSCEARKKEPSCLDDDIEDFSTDEDRPSGDPLPNSVCSSSKFSLRAHGVLASQSASQSQCKARQKDFSSASTLTNVDTTGSKFVFPSLTVSPLRMFQLIDSDSDDPSEIVDISQKADPLKSNPGKETPSIDQKGKKSAVPTPDLWKDFWSEKKINISTPAFDELCEEYFRSAKHKTALRNNCEGSHLNFDKINQKQQERGSLPPSHYYFFHENPRICKVVRDRLPNFFPLGADNNQGYKHQNASVIDYRGQFTPGEKGKQTAKGSDAGGSSTRTRKNVRKSNVDNILQASDNWVNPKSSDGIPKDAGKRRVHAVGQSAGHWYTGSDGRRVYVNKNGKLSGQIAYRHYRKDSGMGFKNSKKKIAAKKKTVTRKR